MCLALSYRSEVVMGWTKNMIQENPRILKLYNLVNPPNMYVYIYMAVCQNLVPLVNIKISGKWMFIPLKMVLIDIDSYPYIYIYYLFLSRGLNIVTSEDSWTKFYDPTSPFFCPCESRGWIWRMILVLWNRDFWRPSVSCDGCCWWVVDRTREITWSCYIVVVRNDCILIYIYIYIFLHVYNITI